MKTDNLLILPDGRKLSYAEFGKPDGHPVLYCHGSYSARLEPLLVGEEVFRQYGLRVIAVDRPGMGESDFLPNREYTDFTRDIVFLADSLGIEKFSILAISGGGPYAAACAANIPQRISKVVLVSGSWQIDKEAIKAIGSPMNLMWQVALHMPFLLKSVVKIMVKLMSQGPKDDYDENSPPTNDIMPAVDQAAMASPERMTIYQKTLMESVKQGVKGAAWDIRMNVRKWDFDPDEIQIPILLFHGGLDRNMPLAQVQQTANQLHNTRLITYPHDGHISTFANHSDEIVKALIPDQQSIYQQEIRS